MDITATAITAGVSCLVTTAIGFIFGIVLQKLRQSKEKNSALEEGVKYLLKDRIHQSCEYWVAKGYCPLRSRKVIIEMSGIYHKLGGNDFVHEEVDEVMKLPATLEEVNNGN